MVRLFSLWLVSVALTMNIDNIICLGTLQVGSAAASLTNLGQPAIDWVQLAGGCGVKASRATSVEEFSTMMTAALNSSGPYLIEAMLH